MVLVHKYIAPDSYWSNIYEQPSIIREDSLNMKHPYNKRLHVPADYSPQFTCNLIKELKQAKRLVFFQDYFIHDCGIFFSQDGKEYLGVQLRPQGEIKKVENMSDISYDVISYV